MLDRNEWVELLSWRLIYFAIPHQKRIQRAHLYQYAEGWIPSTFQLKVLRRTNSMEIYLIKADDDRPYPVVTVIEVLCSFSGRVASRR
ncbi:hypothetical protein ARMSODRAFT_961075 [Armillaria solidipes]|uniref:Uncharacterized protein n=1 Tax=Armillaria solidipes TaxID=1076256 RepID=A0A2H3BRJ7_9AGAR|nr:hypothetical protein ARMSODRAFT_961075 [Armillaria solidipes]